MADEHKSILVVDDEKNVRLVLKNKLAKLENGYHIETARTGEEALRKVAEQDFDLVISDLRMPGIDGLTLLRRIRTISPQTRFILITAFGTDEVEMQARLLYTDEYITKPFILDELVAAAARALGKTPLEDSLTIAVRGEFDIIDARLKARKLATAKGFDIVDQARISLAASSLAKILGLGDDIPGRVTVSCLNADSRIGLQIICIKVASESNELDMGVFEDMRKMVDELKIEDLPSQDLQITLVKWAK